MKKVTAFGLLFFLAQISLAQNAGINATGATPDPSSILDLNTGNNFVSPNGKGLIIPNIALTATSDAVTVASPLTSLLVYNTATAGAGSTAVSPGYYYWDGTKWVAMGGQGSTNWALLGNAGTTAGTNFLGTTDAQALLVRTNNFDRIRIMSDVSTIVRVGIGTNFPTSLPAAAGNTSTLLHLHDGGVTATDFSQLTLSGAFVAATSKLGEISFAATAIAAADRRTASIESYLTAVTGVPNISGDLRFFTNNSVTATFTEKMRIQANGRVGMGTTAPAGQLDVVIETGSPTALFSNYGNVNEIYFQRAQGSLAAPTIIGSAGVLGRLLARGYDGAAFQSSAQIAFEVDATSGAGDMPGRILFSTTLDGTAALTERMRITNAGNVGIANAAPSEKLDVTGNIRFSGALMPNNLPGAAGQVLVSAGAGAAPTWAAGGGGGWSLTGNAGTDGGATNFIGTTDAKAFSIRVGGVGVGFKSGLIDWQLGGSTFFGYKSGKNVLTGDGLSSTGMGFQALTAVAAGGTHNSAFGRSALEANVDGTANTAIGSLSMQQNVSGMQNTAVGVNSLNFTTGNGAGLGEANTSVGYQSLYFNNTGSYNTAVGNLALNTNNTGTFLTALGSGADVSSTALTNATAIGANAIVSSSNAIVLGNAASVLIGRSTTVNNAKLSIKDGHIQTSQTTAPTIAVTANAGTASTAIFGAGTSPNDITGQITLTEGTGAWATGVQCTVTFNKAYATAPIVIITPINAAAASGASAQQVFITSTATTFSINFGVAAAGNTAWKWSYIVVEP